MAEFVSVTMPVTVAVPMLVSVEVTVIVAVYVSVTEFDRVCGNACCHCCFHDNVSDLVTSDLVISDQ